MDQSRTDPGVEAGEAAIPPRARCHPGVLSTAAWLGHGNAEAVGDPGAGIGVESEPQKESSPAGTAGKGLPGTGPKLGEDGLDTENMPAQTAGRP